MKEQSTNSDCAQHSQTYEIRVRACLDLEMVGWLGDFSIRYTRKDETVLTGALPDQAALFGLLQRLHNLGIPLILVKPLLTGSEGTAAGQEE